MGKRLSKEDLLAEISVERKKLMELLDEIPKSKFNIGTLNSAGWSIKDVLTHLLGWEVRVVRWCEAGLAGETPEVPGDGFTWQQTPQLNAKIQKKHNRKSVVKVRKELNEIHEQTLAVIDRLNKKQLTDLNHFEWTGKSWTVSDYLRSNTASHYKWAGRKIRKWLKAND